MVAFSSLAPDFTLGTLTDMMEVFRRSSAWLLWPLIALVPGLCEELFFRGLLQRSLGNGPLAIGVAAIAFALVHLDPPHVLGVLPLGLFFGWVAARTGSVLVPMVAHVSNNTVSLVAMHVSALDVGFGTERPMPLWWSGAGAVLAAACVFVVWSATRRRLG
jgi:membrane protease YdiL (CAAX protease family)